MKWLASWNSLLFCPVKKIGMTVAFDMRRSFAVKGAQGRSTAWPFSGFSDVATPPPGKIPTAWPSRSRALRGKA